MNRQTLVQIIVVAIFIAGVLFFAGETSQKIRPAFKSDRHFFLVWRSTTRNDRSLLLPYLLGAEAQRSTHYRIGTTRLNRLSREEVLQRLGNPDLELPSPESSVILVYRVGSIEKDPIGGLVPGIAKSDSLWIYFDELNDTVAKIKTTS